jgi:hypothetical protein
MYSGEGLKFLRPLGGNNPFKKDFSQGIDKGNRSGLREREGKINLENL